MRISVHEQFIQTSQKVEGFDIEDTVMGIDPSATNTGIAVLRKNRIKFFTIGWGTDVNQIERLALFMAEMQGILDRYQPSAIALEGYSFASKFSQLDKLGEIGGTIKLAIRDYGKAPLTIVPPSTLKQFVRGIGKGTKADMIRDAKKRWGFRTSQNDEIDAGALAFVAAEVQYHVGQTFGHVLYKDGKGKGGVEIFQF